MIAYYVIATIRTVLNTLEMFTACQVIRGIGAIVTAEQIGGKKVVTIYESNQQDALYRLIYYSTSALHVSGHVFHSRHQPAATWLNTTRYDMI